MINTDIEDYLIEGTMLYSMEPKSQKIGNKVHNLNAVELK
jgi:hypothetical protein